MEPMTFDFDIRNDMRESAREDLGRYRHAKKDIAHIELILTQLREDAQKVTHAMNEDRLPDLSDRNRTEDAMVRFADKAIELSEKQKDAERICEEVKLKIGRLQNPQHRRILLSHWIYGIELQKIADAEECSYSAIRGHHQTALEEYGKLFGAGWR